MLEINKILFSESSGFERTRAMELANLLEVAYSEYETWDNDQTHSPSDKILGSTEFVDLEMTLELPVEKPKLGYGRLDAFWKTKTVKQYDRIANFWATEWWWLRLLDIPFLSKALKGNLGDIFQGLNHREGLAGLVESAKQLSKGLLDNFKDLVVDDQLFGFIARSQMNPNEVFVVFRGTREAAEWLNNFRPVPKFFLEGSDFGRLGEVRNGFNRVYSERNKGEQPTIKETIERWFGENSELLNRDTQIFITGHSLGAALATLATVHIKKLAERQGIEPNIYLYTFASPRVGGAEFSQHF